MTELKQEVIIGWRIEGLRLNEENQDDLDFDEALDWTWAQIADP
jgi:hypothetical protein